ncbi:Alpha/Beta hydrolase protein, partial [Cladochytrium replicatum]
RSILVPDPTDPDLVLNVGAMTFNTYYDPSKKEKSWIDYGYWNESTGFGWESDGIRGYVFADPSNEIMVITVKGTSPSFIGIGDGPTAPRDKYNDNMMFSCCCAKAGWSWTPVCDCSTANKKCDSTCLARESSYADSYYNMAQTIYVAVSAVYSYASIWMAGHSLGGSLASLVALTNGVPAMTFEAPGDLLYASRIGLLPDMPSNGEEEKQPDPRGRYGGAYGNNEDPIFLGICTGPGSTCWFGGYAMESRCHVGKTCTYNDKEYDKNRGRTKSAGSVPTTPPDHDREVDVAADMGKHGIDYVIKHYLAVWKYVPDCIFEEGCRDCEDWEFYD